MVDCLKMDYLDLPTTHEEVNLEHLEDSICCICRALLPQWSDISSAELTVSEVSGGISNLLFKAEVPNRGSPVLVRIFGNNTDLVVDRKIELCVMQYASSHGFNVKVLGLFANGRLETFLDSRSLTVEEMRHPAAVSKIAKKLAELHNLRPEMPDAEPRALYLLKDYLSKVEQLHFEDETKQKLFEKCIDLNRIKNSIKQAEVQFASFNCPLVLCHNDLLSGNILLLKQAGKCHTLEESEITLIDFEYSSYSYRGFDFADHFMEYQGSEMNPSLYPSEKEQRTFLQYYLKYSSGRDNISDNPSVDQLLKETEFFKPFPPALWGLWAIIQARYSSIDFDYLQYAIKCLSTFLHNFENRQF